MIRDFDADGRRGAGRALIGACEDHSRTAGIGHTMIGVHAKKKRTAKIYARAGNEANAVELRKNRGRARECTGERSSA